MFYSSLLFYNELQSKENKTAFALANNLAIEMNKITRRQFLSFSAVTFSAAFPVCQAMSLHGHRSTLEIEETDNLQALAREAASKAVPIVLFITAPDCHYCHQLERDAIQPMLKNQQYKNALLLRRFNIANNQVIDFDGQTRNPIRIAGRYRAQLTPSILFLSPHGEEIAEKLQGVAYATELYGEMIDARLNQSLQKLQNPLRITHQ